ncbi:hypothetical protein [Streptomyces sp. NPDC046979]|uniref:hypothetical protein n=1 Tax=Streptomyces sp. NPDC046979 TaxID=3154604 RepID=UPI0033EC322D
MDYAAMYRQAMTEGRKDQAHTIVVSASQAAQAGGLTPEELSALVDEVKANPCT